MKTWGTILALFTGLCLPVISQISSVNAQNPSSVTVRRVLLLSVDGLHGLDLANFVRSHPNSALAKLTLDPSKGCVQVYPHSFLRVNTIFEVAHSAGMRTAWIDKHPSYEMVSGPSGMGVDDLYTPEIGSAARDVKGQEAYDDVKVDGILNEIGGKDHAGKPAEGEPALFGMAFQAFRFAQVIPTGG